MNHLDQLLTVYPLSLLYPSRISSSFLATQNSRWSLNARQVALLYFNSSHRHKSSSSGFRMLAQAKIRPFSSR